MKQAHSMVFNKGCFGILLCLALCTPLHAYAESKVTGPLVTKINLKVPGLSEQVLNLALTASKCAATQLRKSSDYLGVIDYSLPSSAKRFWLLDLKSQKLLLRDFVAHGRGSGDNWPNKFSNEPGSLMSSLGLFTTGETYFGDHGYSLRLIGLEDGVNDRAFDRAVVMHGADYVSQGFINRWHRLGRSWGCPALPIESTKKIIDVLKEGAYLFAYYPDRDWLTRSSFLNGCNVNTL